MALLLAHKRFQCVWRVFCNFRTSADRRKRGRKYGEEGGVRTDISVAICPLRPRPSAAKVDDLRGFRLASSTDRPGLEAALSFVRKGGIRALGNEIEKPTVKQHLAAIRMLFDWVPSRRGPFVPRTG